MNELTPIEIAQFLYLAHGKSLQDFATDLWEHLQNGFVFSTPCHLLLARAVMLDDGRHAWLVTIGVGTLKELMGFCPFKLEWIAFQRRNTPQLRVYAFDRFVELVNRVPQPDTQTQKVTT